MSSSLQLGNNFVVLESVYAIKGDAATQTITVEYEHANLAKEISVTVKPKAFKSALQYCRDKIDENSGLSDWDSDWEVAVAPVPVLSAPAPAPTDNKKEAIAANPPAHIFVGNQVYTRENDSNDWVVAHIKKVDLDNQTVRMEFGPFEIPKSFAKILPVRQNRDQPEPDWCKKKVLYMPKDNRYTLVEGTIVADVTPNVVIEAGQKEAEIVPFSHVYVIL